MRNTLELTVCVSLYLNMQSSLLSNTVFDKFTWIVARQSANKKAWIMQYIIG